MKIRFLIRCLCEMKGQSHWNSFVGGEEAVVSVLNF